MRGAPMGGSRVISSTSARRFAASSASGAAGRSMVMRSPAARRKYGFTGGFGRRVSVRFRHGGPDHRRGAGGGAHPAPVSLLGGSSGPARGAGWLGPSLVSPGRPDGGAPAQRGGVCAAGSEGTGMAAAAGRRPFHADPGAARHGPPRARLSVVLVGVPVDPGGGGRDRRGRARSALRGGRGDVPA